MDVTRFAAFAKILCLEADEWPAFVIEDTVANLKFPFRGSFDTDQLEAFIRDYLEGNLEPTLRSEPIPETQNGPVTVLVANTFSVMVQDPAKDVLVQFYAPWCRFCKK